MLVDGKKIAAEIYADIKSRLAGRGKAPCLNVFACAPNAETRKYLELKQRRAAEVGIDLVMVELEPEATTEDAERVIRSAVGQCDGVIVQLPFPPYFDTDRLVAAIPPELDVDALGYHGGVDGVLPPVVGAIAEISKRHGIDWTGKQVVVVGRGRLVGAPAALWAEAQSAAVTVLDKGTPNADESLRAADIIISGAGVPGLITPDKIKDGVMLFDAGTSEAGGELRGDADPAVASKCALFTPVPGGIGPITIAVLLRNLALLSA